MDEFVGKEKPRLGRGLASLVSHVSAPAVPATPPAAGGPAATEHPGVGSGVTAAYLEIDLIDPNPYQPRTQADDQALEDLAGSIREHGIVQPIVVRLHEGRHQLIAGQRRLEAARRCGLEMIPAIVRQANDQDMLEVALVENIHREDLNCVDRAKSYRRYQDSFGLGPEQIAERLGQDRTTVVNYLRLLTLPDEVLGLLRADRLTMGHARALAGLENTSAQIKLAVRMVQQELSVRQAEALVTRTKSQQQPPPTAGRPPNVVDLEQQMTRALSTKVHIRSGRKKDSGRIVIEFYNLDDFDRIMDCICGEQREEL